MIARSLRALDACARAGCVGGDVHWWCLSIYGGVRAMRDASSIGNPPTRHKIHKSVKHERVPKGFVSACARHPGTSGAHAPGKQATAETYVVCPCSRRAACGCYDKQGVARRSLGRRRGRVLVWIE
jgi:hypothetical protein